MGPGRHKAAYAGTVHRFCMQIAVIGHAQATPDECEAAYAAGRLIAGNGAVLVCGGLGGVMEAACRGAQEAGGTTVGILPGTEGGNPYLDITIRTGLGHARNVLVSTLGRCGDRGRREATGPSRRSRSRSRPAGRYTG